MNALSLFDGMSGGQQALERSNIKIDKYFASEIDKHAIKLTMANYPNTIQLGNVVDIDCGSLPIIHILIGGSPCQSFSFAGKRKGMSTKDEIQILTLDHYLQLKKEGYEFEGQSYLFWEYMRILTELKKTNPNIKFLLENVEMGEKWEKVLSKAIGVNGIHINSALVSAQNRRRIYWTNIGMQPAGLFGDMESVIKQPKNRHIFLKDIIQDEVDKKYFLSDKMMNGIIKKNPDKSYCIDANYYKGTNVSNYLNKSLRQLVVHNNLPITDEDSDVIEIVGSIKFGRTDESKIHRKESIKKGKDHTPFSGKEIVGIDLDKMNTLTTAVNKDNLLSIDIVDINKNNLLTTSQKDELLQLYPKMELSPYQGDKIHVIDQKMQSLSAQGGNKLKGIGIINNSRIRRLTPIEAARLQTVYDDYVFKNNKYVISENQTYKCLGNGWTIDIIAHILSYI